MKKPTLQSHNINNEELNIYATKILDQMRTNSDVFIDPTPNLDKLETILLEFQQAVTDAAHRDQRAILLRDEKRKELLRVLRLLSFYVAQVADGDVSLILLSGYVPSRTPGSTGDNPKPETPRAKPQIGSCAIDLSVKPWRPARVYQFEYRKKNSDDPWHIKLSSNSRCRIADLERFQEYEFRVSYIGKSTEVVYSDIISSYVY